MLDAGLRSRLRPPDIDCLHRRGLAFFRLSGRGSIAGGWSHQPRERSNLWRNAVQATLHCLTGCAIGEILGMVIATALGWGNVASVALSVALAFLFGYGLTIRPVLRAGVGVRRAAGVALAADTVSIATMEIVDNALILAVPGAIAAGLDEALFWWSLSLSLVIAFVLTVPVNRWLIARGRGHATVHELHTH